MALVFLSLGSNLGDRAENLRRAREALRCCVTISQSSRIYETLPWGYTDQPVFLNQVVAGETALGPEALLTHLKFLEATLGRTPSFRYGPRRIDLDVLFYDNLVMETPRLTIPHPRLHERAFVLVPLAEIAPNFRHPVLKVTIADLLNSVSTHGVETWQQSE